MMKVVLASVGAVQKMQDATRGSGNVVVVMEIFYRHFVNVSTNFINKLATPLFLAQDTFTRMTLIYAECITIHEAIIHIV